MIKENDAVAILAARLAYLRPLCQEEREHRWLDVLSSEVARHLWRQTSRRWKTKKGSMWPSAERAPLTLPIGRPRSGRFAIEFLNPGDVETGMRLEAVADLLSATFFLLRTAQALPSPLSSAKRSGMLGDLLAEGSLDADVRVQWARRVLACEAHSASQPRMRRRTEPRAKFVVCEVSRLCELHFGAPMHGVVATIATKLGVTAGARGALTREVSRSARR
jgi:hypothetical protein